jgi:hypothetical protein
MAVAYIANCTQSTGNPVRMSVPIEIQPVTLDENISKIVNIIIIIKNFHVRYVLFNLSKNGLGI